VREELTAENAESAEKGREKKPEREKTVVAWGE
jgi:hypothetical protein